VYYEDADTLHLRRRDPGDEERAVENPDGVGDRATATPLRIRDLREFPGSRIRSSNLSVLALASYHLQHQDFGSRAS
jgi:hypothetical protein